MIKFILLGCACIGVCFSGYASHKKVTSSITKAGEITQVSSDKLISGVYPHLSTYSHARENGIYKFGDECGIGAIAVWGGRLYMVNYAAHQPKGSEHKLYIIDKDKSMSVFPGSVGGTPAARMIHQESGQLLIGHYLIGENGEIRTIPIKEMPGRITAIARHLKDPKNKVYYFDMEGMLYEANIQTLEVTKLYHNPLPGWHGKGGYTAQGKLVLSNNGEHTGYEKTKDWQVPVIGQTGYEKFGILAEFDGDNFTVTERKQFTDITTRHGINAVPDDRSPLWAMGWDKHSIRLKVMENGTWTTFLLPKATNNNDPSHGWFTEWPRIREIGNNEMMMDMHGMFYNFPSSFSSSNSKGITPIGSHLRYIPDFCSWNGQIVLATDESSIQGNPLTGQPQSNLWFGTKADFKDWGPATGYGAIYLKDTLDRPLASLPYLFSGFDNRIAHIVNHGDKPFSFDFETDKDGNGTWERYQSFTVAPGAYEPVLFPKEMKAEWIRVASKQAGVVTIAFHYTTDQYVNSTRFADMFQPLAEIDSKDEVVGGKLFTNRSNYNMSCFANIRKEGEVIGSNEYEFGKFNFDFQSGITDTLANRALNTRVGYSQKHRFDSNQIGKDKLRNLWSVDEASVILYTSKGNLRLPKGNEAFSQFTDSRVIRELESEREVANLHGTFYELPLEHVGKEPLFSMMRPISSHNKQIDDYNTWNGLLVISGLNKDAVPSNQVYKSENGDVALWFGSIDDLWKLGKPVGKGGPWKNTAVKKGTNSDPYLMTGYDDKTLVLSADKEATITLRISIAHYLDETVVYKTFPLKAGQTIEYKFPKGFSAHWAYLSADTDCTATATFIYK